MPTRPLEFRIWDIQQSRYLATRDGVNYQLLESYEASRNREMGRGVGFETLGWAIRRPESYIVEQLTGFRDKHGKSIYENDLVNFTNRGIVHGPEPEFVFNALVWFDEEDGCWTFGKWSDDYNSKAFEYGYTRCGDRIDMSTLEVTGNIHENGEKLNHVN